MLAFTVVTNVSHNVYNQKWPKNVHPQKSYWQVEERTDMDFGYPWTFQTSVSLFFLYATKRLCTFEYDGYLDLAPFLISVWPDEYQWVEWIMIK